MEENTHEKISAKMDLALGGQALIEGVMIRTPHAVSIAVRKPDGTIIVKKEAFHSLLTLGKSSGAGAMYWLGKFFRLPIIRGIINLFEMMIVGMKALDFSVQEAANEEPQDDKKSTSAQKILGILSFTFSIVVSLAFGLFLFKFVPLYITDQLQKVVPNLKNSTLLFNLTDGFLRIAIFFIYLLTLSIFKSFRRVFEYHGAEHKAVFAHEKGLPLTPEQVQQESPRHPRCGTSFIMVVLIISIVMFSFVPRHPILWIHFLRRLAIIPLIAGIAYEILKWSAKHRDTPFVHFLTMPGILTQYITTKEPDMKQVEVAIAAVKAALEAEVS